ncbi:MAG: MFS transporter, partial [Myxococcota bacterium]
ASAALFGVGTLWHAWILPTAPDDTPRPGHSMVSTAMETVRTFFAKADIVHAILFIGFFRFAENHMSKLLYPFLIDPVEAGGLGLTTAAAAVAKGTVGLSALTVGGILGGYAIYRNGLKAWLWPMAIAINVPNIVYVYLAWAQPESYALICTGIAIESFGYGFGFTAYLMYMIRFAEGPYKTAHYAFATGLMALAVSLASFWSGPLQEEIGYRAFFAWVCVATVPGFVVTGLIDVPADFGRRKD